MSTLNTIFGGMMNSATSFETCLRIVHRWASKSGFCATASAVLGYREIFFVT